MKALNDSLDTYLEESKSPGCCLGCLQHGRHGRSKPVRKKLRQGGSRVSGRVDLRFNSISPLTIIISPSTRASLGMMLRDVIVHFLMIQFSDQSNLGYRAI